MNFFILGCNGMAGHTIGLYLKENGHKVIGFARKKSLLMESIVGDATDLKLLSDILLSNKFDAIINCIGVLNQFAENDKSNAVYINAFLPHFLAMITKNVDTQIVQISTDCVFSGKRGKYTEYDIRDGNTFYDRSKALGEIEDNKNLTLRQSIVGPDINVDGIGLLNWFMKQKNNVNGYVNSIWTGQTTLQLAKTIEFMVKKKIFGLYNAVPNTSISKYELLCLFNKYFKQDKINIIPVNNKKVDKSLECSKWNFDFKIPDYETMINELSVWIKNHKSFYPHYAFKNE